jgi:uncharacterized membrane protein
LASAVAACHAPQSSAKAAPEGVTLVGDDAHPVTILALSSDGRVAAGYAYDSVQDEMVLDGRPNGMHLFLRDSTGALRTIKTSKGDDVDFGTLSADGQVVAGRLFDASGPDHLFRWTEQGGLEDLGIPDRKTALLCWACGANASGVSNDGYTILGRLETNGSFRWTRAGGFQDLHIPAKIWRASSDGENVGAGDFAVKSEHHVFRWSATRGFEDLGRPIGTDDFLVRALSSDGSTIAGTLSRDDSFLWTRKGGFQRIRGGIRALSGNGSKAFGSLEDATGAYRAAVWEANKAPKFLTPASFGIVNITAASADGKTLAGLVNSKMNRHGRAFLLHLK